MHTYIQTDRPRRERRRNFKEEGARDVEARVVGRGVVQDRVAGRGLNAVPSF
jgi:hypothetical protein